MAEIAEAGGTATARTMGAPSGGCRGRKASAGDVVLAQCPRRPAIGAPTTIQRPSAHGDVRWRGRRAAGRYHRAAAQRTAEDHPEPNDALPAGGEVCGEGPDLGFLGESTASPPGVPHELTFDTGGESLPLRPHARARRSRYGWYDHRDVVITHYAQTPSRVTSFGLVRHRSSKRGLRCRRSRMPAHPRTPERGYVRGCRRAQIPAC
jgi:hypothetical protein